ncbi:tripartite tricarboxylate transporter permease [Devosia sp. J2-20]|jgi:putative tricarboxylic transport membrane protein|uniref:Tripartite tricarboxylate transporter permease n=1 Tax=Devosia litorisediminis TaxID=2829817 RepID=A0A942E5Y2_9HYPH|nr:MULTISPECIES: tripartite tricarboxylate transporter permease [Devosia]MBS3848081.1 tripartite tricarboxylate transporter permease [Devosia litorisediminis]MCZ4345408.1 tripartite tricarboxylate transporter permease [Devosia neptuniae]WDQ98820.1 tripartite tricarboxylate transporter permease [Devosia sp. J2-20]|tara:strand:- start:28622 stop:30163 length:1542 start_codon:yes stop_codon:yes gene_type:complete
MDSLQSLADGFLIALTWQNLGLALIGCLLGTIIGALPGLGPSNGVAIMIPLVFTLGLPATPALILLTSVYYGAMYGGRISSILLNIPGDEPALMTTLDGYPMARKGQAGEALSISGISSFVGSFFATWGLVFLAPQLVKVALLFGPAEYFALFTLAFATLGGLASRNQAKAAFAAALGLAIALIGVDGQTGVPRFTFGEVHFYDGIDFLVAIVGMFALSEVFTFLEHRGTAKATGGDGTVKLGRITPPVAMLKQTSGSMARGTVLGFIAGVLPGAGASLGSFIAYSFEKRLKDKNGTFGKGDPRGVAAPEAGNNAAAGGALVPMLALGVPGSGTTAVLLAMLLALNITPGPLLFQNNPDVVWGLIAALFIANFMLLALNIPMVGFFVRLLMIPPRYLMPGVAMISFVGIYGVSGSTFDLMVMIAFGVLGWVLRKLDIPLVPIILGVLLGDQMEKNLRRAMTISDGDVMTLVASPLSIALWTMAIVGFILPVIVGRYLRPKIADKDDVEGADPD